MSKTFFYEASSMEDSRVYKMMTDNNSAIDTLIDLIKNGIKLQPEHMQDVWPQLKRGFFSSLSPNVIKAYESGKIQLMYTPNAKRVNTSIPFIIRRDGTDIVATVFITTFGKMNADGTNFDIPVRTLYILMESAYIGLITHTQALKVERNSGLMKICNSVYVNMMIKILNRDYSINMNKELYGQINFILSRFFLEKIWGLPGRESCTNYAINFAQEQLGSSVSIANCDINNLNATYNDKNPQNIIEIFDMIKSLSPRLSTITFRYFLERYINMYHPSAILAIDYLPYVFMVISNVLLGGFVMNQGALSDTIKSIKGINIYYNELAKFITM